jgi:starch synthase
MIQVLHVSSECYPAAKTGGLGDVVGSLPKYMTQSGMLSAAIIPKYALKWIQNQEWEHVHGGAIRVDWRHHGFSIQKEKYDSLGFPLFVVDIPGLFDRPGIYSDPNSGNPYGDETERYLTFQQAVLHWVRSFPNEHRPKVLHCHDHHTGLIPFMTKFCPEYQSLASIPTVFTIHNGQYQGWFSWDNEHLLPYYAAGGRGILDWKGVVNPLAAAVKAAWAVTTVSPSYLYELHQSSIGLEPLFQQEWQKEHGILNGIDAAVWDPATDPSIQYRLEGDDVSGFKQKNKAILCETFGLNPNAPLVSFIGRMVSEKGVDLLPDTIRYFLNTGSRTSFLILGTGEAWNENQFRSLSYEYQGRINAVIDYNEALAHQIYAGSDYLLMPSRVEPCGLNQMYAMRYGTIPIVRSVGGLKDTVPDISEPEGRGRGIRFEEFSTEACYHAIHRAVSMYYNDPEILEWLRAKVMQVDFSWEHAISHYVSVYNQIGGAVGPVKKTEVPAPEKPASKPRAKRATTTKSEAKTETAAPEKPVAKPRAKRTVAAKSTPKAKTTAAPKKTEQASKPTETKPKASTTRKPRTSKTSTTKKTTTKKK